MPVGYGRSRSHKRTDSRAESSDTNTPDPMSPHPQENHEVSKDSTGGSPLGSPPATPLGAASTHEDPSPHIPSISVLRRRTFSRAGIAKDKDAAVKEENRCSTPDHPEVQPFDRRNFPLDEHLYEDMLKSMPEDHQLVSIFVFFGYLYFSSYETSQFCALISVLQFLTHSNCLVSFSTVSLTLSMGHSFGDSSSFINVSSNL